MIITQAKMKGYKEVPKGLKLYFFIPVDRLTPDLRLEIMQTNGSDSWLSVSPDKLKAEVEQAMKNRKIGIDTEGHSSSEKLRGAIYKYWTLLPGVEPFEEFYCKKMQGFLDEISKNISEIELNQMADYYEQKFNKGCDD